MKSTPEPRDLRRLFAPRSICIVGASGEPNSISGRPLRILRHHGFAGPIYPVNPKYEDIDGIPCFGSVGDLPEVPDVALVVVPAPSVPALLEECGRVGIPNAIVISSGFEEDDSAIKTVDGLHKAIDRYGITVVGPNSEGIWSVPGNAIMTFGSAALRADIIEGPVSIISQSGSIGGSTARSLQARGVGCRYFISAGNETALTAADYLDFVVAEGGTQVVALFLEGLDDGQRFLAAAERALAAGIAVVALKAGSSEMGSQSAASHTGKITSPADVYSHVLEVAGVIEVATIGHLADASEVLAVPQLRLPLPRSDTPFSGIALVAPGATRTVMADVADRLGVPLARFSSATEEALGELIPSYGFAKNPVDVTAQLSTTGVFQDVISLMCADTATDALVIQWGNRGVGHLEEVLQAAISAQQSAGKPVFVGMLADRWDLGSETRQTFRSAGIGCGATPDEVMQQLAWLYRLRDAQIRGPRRRRDSPCGVRAPLADAGLPSHSWEELSRWLEAGGFRLPRSLTLDSDARADWLRHLDEVGIQWPVVVKAHPDSVRHKTDRGLVAVDLGDERAALESLRLLRERAPDVDRFLVQEMVPPGVEVLVTVRRDPNFGPLLTIGVGGELVELIGDVRHLAVPVDRRDLSDAIDRTRLSSLLAGVRGAPPADREALLDAVLRLASRYQDVASEVCEIELNPVIVSRGNQGVWVVDASSS